MSSNVLIESDALPSSTVRAAVLEADALPTSTVPAVAPPAPQRKRRLPISAPPARRRNNNLNIDLSTVPEGPVGPSSPGGDSVVSTDSQQFASTSDDDSTGLDVPKKRLRVPSPPVCSTESVGLEVSDYSTPSTFTSTTSSYSREENYQGKFLDVNKEYQFCNANLVFEYGSADYATFNFKQLTPDEHKRFLTIAQRVQAAREYYEPSEYRRIKAKIIPNDTRIVYNEKNEPFLLTHFNGENLDTYVKKHQGRPLSEELVQPIIKQILEILEFCHTVNIFMLDFKLTKFVFNEKDATEILLSTPMCLKMSNSIDDDRMFQRAASLIYISPEMLGKDFTFYTGASADMYALGVMTFSLLTQKYPFAGKQPPVMIECIRLRKFTTTLEVSSVAKAFVYGLLSVKPADRGTARSNLMTPWMLYSPQENLARIARWNNYRDDSCLERIARHVRLGFQNAMRDAARMRNNQVPPTTRSMGVQAG